MSTSSSAPEEAIRECLPCPFCGSDKIKDQYIRDGRAVGCVSCGAHVQAFNPYAREAAIAAWNRRAGGERERELAAALEFYRDVWTRNFPWIELLDDRGAKARAALAGQTEGERNG